MDHERKRTEEEQFRSSLEDVATILVRLGPLCATPKELHELVQLALANDGQMRLLMKEVTSGGSKR